MVHSTREKASKIRLLVSDIDGTLVSESKEITKETQEAAQELQQAGIKLCLVSSRPPQGVQLFFDQLGINTPFAALNGGEVIGNNGTILSSVTMDFQIACEICDLLEKNNIIAWVLGGFDWCVFHDITNPFTQYEIKVIGITPKIIHNLNEYQQHVVKIEALTTDVEVLTKIAQEIEAKYPGKIAAVRSNEHYLDITHPSANKGYAAVELGKQLGIDISEIACIGDMNNDIPMLDIAGLSIAMGQSCDDVKKHAQYSTDSNENNGWAKAVKKYILPRA